MKKIENVIGNKINYNFSQFNLIGDNKNEKASKGISELKRDLNQLRSNNIQIPKNEFLKKTTTLRDYVVDFIFDDHKDQIENKALNKYNLSNMNKDVNGNINDSTVINNEDIKKVNENHKNQKLSFDNFKIHDFLHSRHSDSREESIIPRKDTTNINKININKNNINISNNPFLNLKNSILNKKK